MILFCRSKFGPPDFFLIQIRWEATFMAHLCVLSELKKGASQGPRF